MKIKTALILCAGFGKRLNPLTLKKPKPLININDSSLLQNTLNLLDQLGIQNIRVNTFYLQNQIIDFVSKIILGKSIHYLVMNTSFNNSGEENCKSAEKNGFSFTIDRTKENIEERVKEISEGKGVSVVYDSIGKDSFETSINSLSPRGYFISFGNTTGDAPSVPPALLLSLHLAMQLMKNPR